MSLLLHSLSNFGELIFAVLEAAEARHIVEIGSETGGFSRELAEWARARQGRLTTIDPVPAEAIRAGAAHHHVVAGRSPAALEGIAPADVYVIDGDHNHWTVSHELRLAFAANPSAVAILHDVGWPCARRDQYYDPSALPPEAVHPHSWDRGVMLGNPNLIDGGFRGEGAFAYALTEGGPKNGVLTAVEDFMAAHPGYELVVIPAVFGLGFLIPAAHPAHARLHAILDASAHSELLARVDHSRLENYLRVLLLQDELGRRTKKFEELEAKVRETETQLATTKVERDALGSALREQEARNTEIESRWYHRAAGYIGGTLSAIRRRPS